MIAGPPAVALFRSGACALKPCLLPGGSAPDCCHRDGRTKSEKRTRPVALIGPGWARLVRASQPRPVWPVTRCAPVLETHVGFAAGFVLADLMGLQPIIQTLIGLRQALNPAWPPQSVLI
jgi:hypothetical protein